MKWWLNAGQYATEALAIVLIFRVFWLRDKLSRIYFVFVSFLALQLIGSIAYFACGTPWGRQNLDYRSVWIFFTIILATLSLCLVYMLAQAVLAELPGILRFSRILLNIVFPMSIVIGASTVPDEFGLSNSSKGVHEHVELLLSFCFVADRAISTASVLILIAILAFILWFPVRMSRDLAIFSIGFVVYFASKTGLELLNLYWKLPHHTTLILGLCVTALDIACFVYWLIFIEPKGESTVVRIGHSWHLTEQTKLIDQLESLNSALMRSGQHLPSVK